MTHIAFKDKPLFSLTVNEYIDLQESINVRRDKKLLRLLKDTDNEELLDVDETAKFLKCSKSTIYTLHSKGKLCSNKINGKLYFLKSGLLELLKIGERKSTLQIMHHLEKGGE